MNPCVNLTKYNIAVSCISQTLKSQIMRGAWEAVYHMDHRDRLIANRAAVMKSWRREEAAAAAAAELRCNETIVRQ